MFGLPSDKILSGTTIDDGVIKRNGVTKKRLCEIEDEEFLFYVER